MKKKVLRLMEQGRFQDQPVFETLYAAHQKAQQDYESAKQQKMAAKEAYKSLFAGEKPAQTVLVQLLGNFRKAKLMQQFYKEEFKLAEYALDAWVHDFLKAAAVPQQSKVVLRKQKLKASAIGSQKVIENLQEK